MKAGQTLSIGELTTLTTKRLLAYLERLNKCKDGPNWDETSTKELYKSSNEWITTHRLVKKILAKREHVE